jgi:hypothetical protein
MDAVAYPAYWIARQKALTEGGSQPAASGA